MDVSVLVEPHARRPSAGHLRAGNRSIPSRCVIRGSLYVININWTARRFGHATCPSATFGLVGFAGYSNVRTWNAVRRWRTSYRLANRKSRHVGRACTRII